MLLSLTPPRSTRFRVYRYSSLISVCSDGRVNDAVTSVNLGCLQSVMTRCCDYWLIAEDVTEVGLEVGVVTGRLSRFYVSFH